MSPESTHTPKRSSKPLVQFSYAFSRKLARSDESAGEGSGDDMPLQQQQSWFLGLDERTQTVLFLLSEMLDSMIEKVNAMPVVIRVLMKVLFNLLSSHVH